jgi:hypothetical protein
MAADNDNNLVLTVSSDMTAAERGIKKFVGDIATGSAQIEKQFQKMGRGIDNSMVSAMQTRIDKMVGIGTKGAQEWTGALADQGKELERLRARYSPLFSTLNTYKATVADIKRAQALGAISAAEMTSAITKERQAALASTAAIKGRNAALADTPAQRGGGSFNASNLAAQGFDTITTAPFMPWYTVALQQGPQVAQVFNDIKASGQSVGPAVAGAFMQILNPMSLLTIGTIAASAAAIQYFSTMDWGGAKSEETLKKEAELIDSVVQKWGDALPALKAYNDERKRVAENQDIKEAASLEADKRWTDLRGQLADVNIEFTDMASRLAQLGKEETQVGNLQRSFSDLANGIEDGTATSEAAKKVQAELLELVRDGANPEIAAFAKTFDVLAAAIAKASGEASKLITDASTLTDIVQKLGPLGQLGPILSGDGKFLVNAADQQAYRAQQEANKNPLVESNGRMIGVPTPESKPVQLGIEPDKAAKKAETAAEKAKNAYRDLLKSADDRIGSLKLETELLGQYGAATDAARFRLDLLQQSEDKGRSLNEKQRAEIEAKVELYKKYSEALGQAKLKQDMLDANRLAGMSKIDQNIVETQKSYGLAQDPNSASGKALRDQINREDIANTTASFLSEFSSGVITGGKSLGESFADAVKNAAANAMQKSLDSLFGQIGNALASALMPGGKASPVGSAASVLASFPAAPGKAASALTAFSPAGASKTGVGLSKITTAGGLTADVNAKYASQFQSLVKDLEGTGYDIKSIGGYNHRNIAGTNKLSNHAFGNAIDINPQANPMGRNLVTDMPAGIGAIANRNGFDWGGDWKSKKDAMHFEVSSAKSASAALDQLAGASTETTKGLGSLANSLVAGGGGKGGGWLSFLAGTSFSGSKQLANSGGIGLFDSGGYTGPGGKMTPAGIVHKGEYVFDAKTVSKLGIGTLDKLRGYADGGFVGAPVAPRLNGRAPAAANNNQPQPLNVTIQGASGDPHVRELVRQGVAQALADKSDNDRRSGFGTMQQRYTSQKG